MKDIIIVGGGPSGLTAAIYAARAGKNVKLYEKENLGGQILFSPLVDNYPAVPHVEGALLTEKLINQIQALEVETEISGVTEIIPGNDSFKVRTELGGEQAKAVILATGVKHRRLGIEGEEDLVGCGISYCAVCDGAFYSGKDVAVIGGGDTALQNAIFLSSVCRHVMVIHRRNEFRAESSLVKRALNNPKIEMIMNYVTKDFIVQDGCLKGLIISEVNTGIEQQIDVEGIFVSIGQVPQNEIFERLVRLDEKGYFASAEDTLTDVKGIFVAGDARRKPVRQLTTAVGDGATAALAACSYIDSLY